MRRTSAVALAGLLTLSMSTVAFFAHPARAGGAHARLVAPVRAGDPYLVETTNCGERSALRLTAVAEGRVNGKRTSIPLRLEPGSAPGQLRLARQWPAEGTWVVRLVPSVRPSATTVVPIGADGRPGEAEFVWNGNGRHEAEAALAKR